MKYFTPERWLRMQKMADPQTVLTALTEWERAIEAYQAEQKRLLPKGEKYEHLRYFASQVCLHDGVVLANWFAGSQLHLVVRPEAPGARLVALSYTLAGDPVVIPHTFPAEVRTDTMEWMYDEIDLLPQPDPDEPVFTHNVLLGNGWELCIPFTHMKLRRPSSWLPGAGGRVGQPILTPTPIT
jgi:hypothetical protein